MSLKQIKIMEDYYEFNISRCSKTQLKQKGIQNWIKKRGIETVEICRPSPYGNPFPHSNRYQDEDHRNYVCDKYEEEILPNISPDLIEQLQGKILICYCDSSKRCHGDSLIKKVLEKTEKTL